jgi:WD40 repeat protein
VVGAKGTLGGKRDIVHAQTWSKDGRLLASASLDHTLKLWDMPAGKERATLKGHGDVVAAVAFNPDGKLVASGSADGTVKLWELRASTKGGK